MFKSLRKRRGQSTVEYAFIFVIVTGAMLAMTLYVKRGIQGRWREAIDGLGDQYAPTNMQTNVLHVQDSNITSVVWAQPVNGGIVTMRRDTVHSVETTEGESTVWGY